MKIEIDFKRLKRMCLLRDIRDFREYLPDAEYYTSNYGDYIHAKREGSKILAVAHTDHVGKGNHFERVRIRKDDTLFCETLDDRLGVYVILDILPRLGIPVDILLTEGEEWGQSTAELFIPDKLYNWTIEFDRAGTDVALYQYRNKETERLVKSVKLTPADGTYTDICRLDTLGIAGFNWGIGYYNQHSRLCHMVVRDTVYMILRFVEFYNLYGDTRIPYEYIPPKYKYSNKTVWTYGKDDKKSLAASTSATGEISVSTGGTVNGKYWDTCDYCGRAGYLISGLCSECTALVYVRCEVCGEKFIDDYDTGICDKCYTVAAYGKAGENEH